MLSLLDLNTARQCIWIRYPFIRGKDCLSAMANKRRIRSFNCESAFNVGRQSMAVVAGLGEGQDSEKIAHASDNATEMKSDFC